jgi:hypothetical protein
VLDERGLSTDPEKVKAVVDYPTPKCVKDCRRLLGMAGWYRVFIPNFSIIYAPITDLTKKTEMRFRWTQEADQAFMMIKQILITAPVLANPDFDKEFTIQCDASDIGIALYF